MARIRITEDFVRHYRLLIEQTDGDPSKVRRALARDQNLATSISLLHEIQERVEHNRRFGPRRYIVQAHPDFRPALEDFRERWSQAYGEAEQWQTAKDFMRHYRLLVQRAGDDPDAARQALDASPELYASIEFLLETQLSADATTRPGDTDPSGDTVDYLDFRKALADFGERWAGVLGKLHVPIYLFDDNFEKVVGQKLSDQTFSELLKDNSTSDGPGRDGGWHFDPDRDSVAEAIGWMAKMNRSLAHHDADDWEGWAAEGLEWLTDTVGLNFDEIQARFKEFPVIAVPQHVSDKYSPERPDGLFGYPTQVRLAYLIGADLTAVVLCRTITELLISEHYASDKEKEGNTARNKDGAKTLFRPLLNQVLLRDEFNFLKKFNLQKKVDDANGILHNKYRDCDDINHRDRERELVRNWIKVLEEMISKAPPAASATKAS